MKVKALKQFSSNICGNVNPGDVFNLPTDTAIQMADHKMVELLQEAQSSVPFSQPSSASPVDQASHLSNAISPKKADTESSESTPQDSSESATSTTLSIKPGGKSTTKKRRGRPPKNGRETSSQP